MFDKRTFQPYVSTVALCSTYSTVQYCGPVISRTPGRKILIIAQYCIPYVVSGNSLLPYFSRAKKGILAGPGVKCIFRARSSIFARAEPCPQRALKGQYSVRWFLGLINPIQCTYSYIERIYILNCH